MTASQLTHEESSGRGYLVALASAATLSTTAIFIRYLTGTYQIPPLLLAFWRAVFVVITLALVLGGLGRHLTAVSSRHLPYLAFHGLVLAAFNSLWTLSVALNGAAVATVLVYCSAAFTALLGWWLLKERLDGAKLFAVALCLGGCVLVAGAYSPDVWTVNPAGIVTGISAGLGYAVYSLLGRAAAQRGLNPWTTLLYTFAVATVFLLLVNLLPGDVVPGTAARPVDFFMLGSRWLGWGVLILLAAGPTVAGFGLYNVSLSLLPSSVANLILTTEPAFTAVMAYVLLGERLTGVQLAGSLLILAGVVWLRLRNGRLEV
jgi:drug/metabolite transporter (DMT)-like permease